MKISQEDGILI